jgi:fatty acid desaturase
MPSNPHATEYAELKGLLAQQGIFDRQPRYYTWKILQVLSGLGLALGLLLTTPLFWLQLLNAAWLACVFTQVAFLGHDAAHRQVFQSSRKTDVFGLLCTLLTAISYSWWTEKHHRHHRHPNHLERDPDVQLRYLAFAEEQAQTAPRVRRLIVKHQAWWFVPMLLLQGFAMRLHSMAFLLDKPAKFPVVEPLGLVIHVGLYLGCVFSCLGLWEGMAFILVHQMLFGLYMGAVFAPNHTGMLVLRGDDSLDRLRQQVLTARNVRAHPVTDVWFGGLNYQIEHHLFPSMPRNQLKAAQATVRAFCQARAIPYHETGVWRAYRDILRHLHRVGAPLRHADREAASPTGEYIQTGRSDTSDRARTPAATTSEGRSAARRETAPHSCRVGNERDHLGYDRQTTRVSVVPASAESASARE